MSRLVSDDDGHWYVIPAGKASAWWSWLESPAAEYDMEPPSWAKRVNGPQTITFKEWKEEL